MDTVRIMSRSLCVHDLHGAKDTMPIFALRDVMNFSFFERRISVHAGDTLAALKASMAYRFLVSAGNFGGSAWVAGCFLLLQTRCTGASRVHALSL